MTQGHKDGFKAITAKIRTFTGGHPNEEDINHQCDDLDEQIDNEPVDQ